MNKQLRKNIALVRGAFIYGNNYFKKAEESKKLKCTIDSHVAYHLRKYYNSLSPSEKLEVELDL